MSKRKTLQKDLTQSLTAEDDLSSIFKRIQLSKKMVFLTGAGISCSAGIPDFRSSEGLYNMTEGLGSNLKGKDLFDISLFQSKESIKCFSTFMSNLYSSTLNANPTTTHQFIHNQISKNKVLRCYTQNIDGLESRLGLNMKFDNRSCSTILQKWKSMEVVQLHGNLNELSCTRCGKTTEWIQNYQKELLNGELPECLMCLESINQRAEKGKRIIGTIGLLRPNIVLYGENHPFSEIITTGLNSDLKQKPDMLIIMGTSLKVHGVKQLVKSMSKRIRSKGGLVILVNKEIITGWNGIIDYQIQSDCDFFVNQYQIFEEFSLKILQTPPATPRKLRIIDLLNSPLPSNKFKIYCDSKETFYQKSAQRIIKPLNFKIKSKNFIKRSPEFHKIHSLLNYDIIINPIS